MRKKRSSFFEKLTGTINTDEEMFLDDAEQDIGSEKSQEELPEEETTDAELTVDVFQTPDDIVIQTIVAGVDPNGLDVSITRDMVTISGHRERSESVLNEDYFHQELYWGGFSRSVLLPEEIDIDASEAIEKNGLLTLRLPKIDKKKKTKLEVHSSM